MSTIPTLSQRNRLANELHARPFPVIDGAGQVAFVALMPEPGQFRDPEAERAHLLDLLDTYGATHPQPGAKHYFGTIGRHQLKWESHSEFVTFTLISHGQPDPDRAFDPKLFDVLSAEWLAKGPYVRVTSALIDIHYGLAADDLVQHLGHWFVHESLAISDVLDQSATIAGDFRIDDAGHMRFAISVAPGTGPARTGRILQRICEIETYKAMAMLGLFAAKEAGADLSKLDDELAHITRSLNAPDMDAEQVLGKLMAVSSRLEALEAETSYRFGATAAYERIVHQRIDVLREARFGGRQTFAEFMMRRFDPAMRTVASVAQRIEAATKRAGRAAEFLRTQVEVARSAQNQALLQSMDQRADAALRLQQTVEGLSVVAISYYAISIAGYLLYPMAGPLGISRGWMMAALTLPIVGLVWLAVRRIRRRIHR